MTTLYRLSLALPLLALLLLAPACGDDNSSDPGSDTGQSDTVAGADVAAPEDTAEPPEDTAEPGDDTAEPPEDTVDPGDDTAEPGVCDGMRVLRISGQVLDVDGNVPTSRFFTFCGNACLSGTVADDGTFELTNDACFPAGEPWPRPMFIFHGAGAYTDLHFDFVPADTVEAAEIPIAETLRVVPVEQMTAFDVEAGAAGALTDGEGFELSWAADAIELPFGQERVAVKRLDAAVHPPVPGVETLTALYALLPDDTVFTTPATVRFPNDGGLAPGAAVEVLALGNLETEGVYPGTLGVVAMAHVDEAGEAIVLDEGEGLGALSWLGYRPVD